MTTSWYEQHAADFAAQSLAVDLSHLSDPFLSLLPPRARILDVGCGPGRDARVFADRGYVVEAIDPSPAMVRLARQHTGLDIRVSRVQDLEDEARFDGIWACASLLHIPRAETAEVYRRLRRALVPGGVLYVSYKKGHGEETRHGRFFHDLTVETLSSLLEDTEFEPARVWETPDARPEQVGHWWINALARSR